MRFWRTESFPCPTKSSFVAWLARYVLILEHHRSVCRSQPFQFQNATKICLSITTFQFQNATEIHLSVTGVSILDCHRDPPNGHNLSIFQSLYILLLLVTVLICKVYLPLVLRSCGLPDMKRNSFLPVCLSACLFHVFFFFFSLTRPSNAVNDS